MASQNENSIRVTSQICGCLGVLACLVAASATRGEETVLGRVEVQLSSEGAAMSGGPLRLPCDGTALFESFWSGHSEHQGTMSASDINQMLANRHVVLIGAGDPQRQWAAQWEPIQSGDKASTMGNLVWTEPAGAGGIREYQVVLKDGAAKTEMNVEEVENRRWLVSHGGKNVLRYNHGIVREEPGRTGAYDRAGYVHPVFAPSGSEITGDFSPEHIHQRGIFTSWVKASFGDVQTDFWALGDSKGRMLPADTDPKIVVGPVFAKLTFDNLGVIEDDVVLHERVTLTVYNGLLDGAWLFDVHTKQTPASVPMVLGKLHYGGTSFRGPSRWLSRSSREVQRALDRGVSFKGADWLQPGERLDVLTSNGDDRATGDRTRIHWVDYTGPLRDGWGGIAMYDHPTNPRHPIPIRIHPQLPYFSLALVQDAPLTVTPEKPLRLLYRVRVHDGRPEEKANEQVATWFTSEPSFVWQPATD